MSLNTQNSNYLDTNNDQWFLNTLPVQTEVFTRLYSMQCKYYVKAYNSYSKYNWILQRII